MEGIVGVGLRPTPTNKTNLLANSINPPKQMRTLKECLFLPPFLKGGGVEYEELSPPPKI
jgi:hypothetical protein